MKIGLAKGGEGVARISFQFLPFLVFRKFGKFVALVDGPESHAMILSGGNDRAEMTVARFASRSRCSQISNKVARARSFIIISGGSATYTRVLTVRIVAY